MNKFSSLSTSVLLALLTSSAAVSAYANGLESVSSRTSARTSNDSGETNTLRIGAGDRLRNRDQDLEPSSLPSINSSGNNFYSDDIVFQADKGNYIASALPNQDLSLNGANELSQTNTIEGAYSTNNSSNEVLNRTDSTIKAIDAIEKLSDAQAQASTPTNSALARSEHTIDLNLSVDTKVRSNNLNSVHSLYVAFDYPKELKESFMMAGDTTVISYSGENTNFMITLKITPLHEEKPLNFEDFKSRLLQRFSDKDKMLFGEYEILTEVKSAQEALNIAAQGSKRSVFLAPLNPNDQYMELSLKGYLKKSVDGFLPDMQNFLYERSIVTNNYIATLSCELMGRQSEASIVKQQFAQLSPLCEQILQSYQYRFY